MQVTLSELRVVTTKLFNHLEELGITSIELTEDYYWNIPKDDLYNPYQSPQALTLGQLSDDWNDLQSIIADDTSILSSDLVDLAAILRFIGQEIVR